MPMLELDPLQAFMEESALAPLRPFLDASFYSQIKHGDFARWRQRVAELPELTASSIELAQTVTIGSALDIDPSQLALLESQLREFIPWRKGPFNLFGIQIDTEWQSQLKWERLSNAISPLEGRTVLDVGSGNGYYGFRMLQCGARLVIGIDPHIAYVAQFWALKRFAPLLPVFVLPLALEQLPDPAPVFDTVFSMGVLYHRRAPIEHLLQLRNSMARGGELVLETLYVDGEEGFALTPEKRYARMSNVWFVPTIKTLVRWLERCRFSDIRIADESVTSLLEQRKTDWMPFESLEDSLQPNDPSKTIEGYPAPKRVVMVCRAD